ncbi:hypothetical protein ACOTR2_00745 (plasmid) [Enterobacter asburiae]
MGRKKTNVMVVGETGAGKTTTFSQVMRILLGQSDISRVRELYRGEDGKALEEDIRQNVNIWYPPKPVDEG